MNYGGLPLNEKISLWRDSVKELEATIGTGRSAPGIISLRYLEEDLRAAYQDWTIKSEDFHKYLTGVNIVEFDEQARKDEDLYH
jgi:hypothetical protein